MATRYESGLEAAPQNYPEVAYPQHEYQQYRPYQDAPIHKPEDAQHYPTAAPSNFGTSTYGAQNTTGSPFSPNLQHATPNDSKPRRSTFFGCSLLVFILACMIALLSAAVIGLAAGTGIEASRANDNASKLAALSSSMASLTATATSTAATATGTAAIDEGCSANPSGVNKTVYTSFGLLGGLRYTIYCNRDTPNGPLLSLFTADFASCMDACTAYTRYEPTNFGVNNNTTCSGVSFIPQWSTKADATVAKAPGNCYLKPRPLSENTLKPVDIGTGVECHAGLLIVG
ncbi:hypothetical protein B0T22DRAFT_439278 [Podospora appendiculata]|uniref:Uncharacterized protein n=1 Tax=Podospora appendiculata TaxID=314037 RepID=A0AAE0X8L2_9PEZI|nr:hypothetical protein B0T22DRAFT_439278 [Podospora appendiculata]